jgi:hypothetical protein
MLKPLFVLACVLLAPTTADAQKARARADDTVVTGCSRYGYGCVSGPTRPARFGREVRMPGGTWIGCAGSCADTLRDETVDFWPKREAERGSGRSRRR